MRLLPYSCGVRGISCIHNEYGRYSFEQVSFWGVEVGWVGKTVKLPIFIRK